MADPGAAEDAIAAAPRPLSVIIPAYNEERTIDEIVRRVLAIDLVKEVIVVDDASTDDTPARLDQWRKHPGVIAIRHEQNRGKGAAIRTGLAAATAEFVIIQDADLEYHPEDYPALLEPLRKNQADVVYGTRYPSIRASGYRGRLVATGGIALLNAAVRWLYGFQLTDEATCYKVFRRSDLVRMQLVCDGFEFCPEVTAKASRLGLTLQEVPIRYSPRTVAEGKKIRFRDGWTALAALWRWRRWRPTD